MPDMQPVFSFYTLPDICAGWDFFFRRSKCRIGGMDVCTLAQFFCSMQDWIIKITQNEIPCARQVFGLWIFLNFPPFENIVDLRYFRNCTISPENYLLFYLFMMRIDIISEFWYTMYRLRDRQRVHTEVARKPKL